MAEERVSLEVRCKEMIAVDIGTLVAQRYQLPLDWRGMEFVRVIGGKPLRYIPRDDFYNTDDEYVEDQKNGYTMIGRYIITGAFNVTSGTEVEISYYQDVPPLGETNNWLVTKYPTLFTVTTLNIAAMYAIEDERGPLWDTEATKIIDKINAEHLAEKASGSRLTSRHRRSFG